MRIKTFQGRSLEELLPEIRAELGAGAVVIGQRAKVQGGVAGFFGTKVIEVTAADRMPSDDQLVDLEDRLMSPGSASSDDGAGGSSDPEEAALAERFRGAMAMGRRGGLDVVDDWDPAGDAELASEYGRVLEHAAAAGGFSELDVPTVERPVRAAAAPAPLDPALDPLAQARMLAERTHERVQDHTARMEESYAPAPVAPAPTYAPPRALPRSPGEAVRSQTFGASVHDTEMQSFQPQAVPSPATAASTVEEALRRDLGMASRPVSPAMRSGDEISDALDAAVDMIDLKAMAALRNAMHASRRLEEQGRNIQAVDTEVELDVARVTEVLARTGVDDDVIEALLDTALRHRRPFGGEQGVDALVRELVEESVDVRTGFPRLGRAYRAAIVGASSSGKTTMVAKLAHTYRAAGLHVGIVSIVSAEPGVALAADRNLGSLDVDVRYAATPDQALHAVDTLASHDLVLVDTPGSTYLDPATFAQVQACLAALGVDDVHVVLPLATSSREARALVDAFRPLGANRMMVSRLDESRYIGQLLNFGFRLGLPMTFLSDGPRTTTDVHAASARDIAARILPTTDRTR